MAGRQAGRQQDQLEARQQASRQRHLCCVRHRSGLIMGDKKKRMVLRYIIRLGFSWD